MLLHVWQSGESLAPFSETNQTTKLPLNQAGRYQFALEKEWRWG